MSNPPSDPGQPSWYPRQQPPWPPQEQSQPWQSRIWQGQTQQQQPPPWQGQTQPHPPWQQAQQEPPNGPLGGPEPGKRNRARNGIIIGASALVLIIVVGIVAGLDGSSKPHHNAKHHLTVAQKALRQLRRELRREATHTPAGQPTSQPGTASVGGGFTITTSGEKYDITLTKVIDPAQGSDEFNTPDSGKRFVGAVFKIKGVSGSEQDDANLDATLIGSNGQTYTADFDGISGYTNFNDGDFNVSPGVNEVGAVTFQVPLGVNVASIQWDPSGGFSSSVATWKVR